MLHPGTVSVWWLPTDGVVPADCRRWLALLDYDERERAGRFRFERDRREFIAAHALLRQMLAFYLGRAAAAWQFAVGDFGKPKIDEKFHLPDIDFNLSHTRDLVAAALVSHAVIGIDVEELDHAKADLEVAHNYFAPSEVEILRNAPQQERAACFFHLWTLKEAYLKATGVGLGTPLDSFAFTLAPLRISFLTNSADAPQRWHFQTLPTTGRHVLSVAVANRSNLAIGVSSRAVTPHDL
jgi:4'-phosphopantetheinyl transferase